MRTNSTVQPGIAITHNFLNLASGSAKAGEFSQEVTAGLPILGTMGAVPSSSRVGYLHRVYASALALAVVIVGGK